MIYGEIVKPKLKIIVQDKEWGGKNYVDIRQWFQKGAAWYPTAKGLMLEMPNELPLFLDILESAERTLKAGKHEEAKP